MPGEEREVNRTGRHFVSAHLLPHLRPPRWQNIVGHTTMTGTFFLSRGARFFPEESRLSIAPHFHPLSSFASASLI